MKRPTYLLVQILLPLLGLLCCFQLFAQQNSNSEKITLNVSQTPVKEVLKKIQQQSRSILSYNHEVVNRQPKVSVKLLAQPLNIALDKVLSQTNLQYSVSNGTIIIFHQPGQVSMKAVTEVGYKPVAPIRNRLYGTVKNETRTLLEGVSVYNITRRTGVFSDSLGHYEIEFLPGDKLVFTHVGCHPQELVATATKKQDITLSTYSETVEAIVVSGYQNMERKMTVGSIPVPAVHELIVPGIPTIDAMLQGKVAGLAVSNTSGGVTASPQLRIRGISTFVGHRQPVWVIDGVVQDEPTTTATSLQSVEQALNSMQGNAISGLNPHDIETITFLKDASAASIYGVRGANGMIVVTTKKGRAGKKPVFTFSTDLGITGTPDRNNFNRMNAAQRITASEEWEISGYPAPIAIPQDTYEWYSARFRNGGISESEFRKATAALKARDTDWMDLLFSNAVSRQHSVDASGGNDLLQYYVSMGMNANNGAADGEKLQRYTGNVRITARPIEKLQLDARINIFTRKTRSFFSANPFDYAWLASTAQDPEAAHYANASTFTSPFATNEYQRLPFNIKREISNTGSEMKSTQVQAQLNTAYTISRDWEWRGLLAISDRADEALQWAAADSWYARQMSYYTGTRDKGISYLQENNTLSSTLRQSFTFSKSFSGRHRLLALAGTEYRSLKAEFYRSVILSGFTTAAYNYRNKYVFNSTVRSDASNQFSAGRKRLITFSLGTRWNLASENFLRHNRLISKLDLRATYGIQGNLVPGISRNLALMIPGEVTDPQFDQYRFVLMGLQNNTSGWERTRTTNLGMDLNLFNDRCGFTVDVYQKRGDQLMLPQNLAYEFGQRNIYMNVGGLSNRGVEATINLVPVRRKDLDWNVSLTISHNKNSSLTTAVSDKTEIGLIADYVNGNQLISGKPVNGFFAFPFAGLSGTNGVPGFNIDPSAMDPSLYLHYQGTKDPVYTGGWQTSLRYKKFRLQAAFSMGWGNKIFLAPLYPNNGELSASPMAYQNLSKGQLSSWQKPGDEKITDVPSISTIDEKQQIVSLPGGYNGNAYTMYDHSDIRVVKGNFLRCSNLQLTYKLQAQLLQKAGIKDAEVRLGGNNLFVLADKRLDGRDPETGSWGGANLPLLPFYNIGFTTHF